MTGDAGVVRDPVSSGRFAELRQVLVAAVPGVDPCEVWGRLMSCIDVALSPRLVDVFPDCRSDLVTAALTGRVEGLELPGAWRPKWRSELTVTRYDVARAGDGHMSLQPRAREDVAADKVWLGLRA